MFSFIFLFLFLAILFVFIIGSSIIRGILNLLFGRRSPYSQHTTHGTYTQSQGQQRTNTTENVRGDNSKKREKIFDASEGEYVDFEEIKD